MFKVFEMFWFFFKFIENFQNFQNLPKSLKFPEIFTTFQNVSIVQKLAKIWNCQSVLKFQHYLDLGNCCTIQTFWKVLNISENFIDFENVKFRKLEIYIQYSAFNIRLGLPWYVRKNCCCQVPYMVRQTPVIILQVTYGPQNSLW